MHTLDPRSHTVKPQSLKSKQLSPTATEVNPQILVLCEAKPSTSKPLNSQLRSRVLNPLSPNQKNINPNIPSPNSFLQQSAGTTQNISEECGCGDHLGGWRSVCFFRGLANFLLDIIVRLVYGFYKVFTVLQGIKTRVLYNHENQA